MNPGIGIATPHGSEPVPCAAGNVSSVWMHDVQPDQASVSRYTWRDTLRVSDRCLPGGPREELESSMYGGTATTR